MKSNAAMNLDTNVTILKIDKNGNVVQQVERHNKATVNLVDGILRFLQGHFSQTSYNATSRTPDLKSGAQYLPVYVKFGNIGINVSEGILQGVGTAGTKPTFYQTDLQKELIFETVNNNVTTTYPNEFLINKIRQTTYGDSNNTETVEFSLYINGGQLVGVNVTNPQGVTEFKPFTTSFNTGTEENPEWQNMISEVGLFSESGNMLARVFLDGDVNVAEGSYTYVDPDNRFNPIAQGKDDTIVIIWRIGITSIGDQDEFVAESDIGEFTDKLSEWVQGYIIDHQQDTLTVSQVKDAVNSKINELKSTAN